MSHGRAVINAAVPVRGLKREKDERDDDGQTQAELGDLLFVLTHSVREVAR